jgi:hypothetical protein
MEWTTTFQFWQAKEFFSQLLHADCHWGHCGLYPMGIRGPFTTGGVWPVRHAEHSPKSSAKVKKELSAIPSFSPSTSMTCTRTALFYYKFANVPLILELKLYNVLNLWLHT